MLNNKYKLLENSFVFSDNFSKDNIKYLLDIGNKPIISVDIHIDNYTVYIPVCTLEYDEFSFITNILIYNKSVETLTCVIYDKVVPHRYFCTNDLGIVIPIIKINRDILYEK